MKNRLQNKLDELFKRKLRDRQLVPDEQLWKNIEQNVSNNIDYLFKTKLKDQQLIPDEQLWNNIEQQFNYKTDNRRFRFAYLAAALLLLIGISVYYLAVNNSSNTKVISDKNVPQNKMQNDNTIAVKPSAPFLSNDDKTKQNGITQKNNLTSSTERNKVVNDQIATTNHLSNTIHQPKENNSIVNEEKNPVSVTIPDIKNPVTENIVTENKVESPVVVNEVKNDSVSQQPNDVVINIPTEPTVKETEPVFAPTPNDSLVESKNNIAEIVNKEVEPEAIKESADDVTSNVQGIDSTLDKPSHKKSHPIFYVQGGVSYINNSKHITTDKSIDEYYAQRRRNDEHSLNTFNYAFILGLQLNHIQLQTGAVFYNLGEKIEYENRKQSLTLLSKGYYSGTVHYDTIYNIVKSDSVTVRNGSFNNYYIGVPVTAYYNFVMQSLKIQIGAGVTGSFPHKWNSYYLNKDVNGLEDPSPENILSPVLFDFNASAGIVIPLRYNFDAIVSVDYRRNLNSVFKKSYMVNQKYQGIGTGLSIRYNLVH